MSSDGEYSDGENTVPADVREELLRSQRLVYALETLAESPEPVPVWDLAAGVCARERKLEPEALAEADIRAIRDDLYGSHLPKLAVTGVIEYDSMLGAVRLVDPDILDTVK